MPPRLALDSFVEVVTDDLRVRSKPGISDDSIMYEPLLWDGALAFVTDGPVAASGYDWYFIVPMGEVDLQYHPDPPSSGWVAAAGKDGEPWLAKPPFNRECPPSPLDWQPYEFDWPPHNLRGLSCYGGETLQFEALLSRNESDCGGEPSWQTEPAWLDPCTTSAYELWDPDPHYPAERYGLRVFFDPAIELGPLATLDPDDRIGVDVVGRYDHPTAGTCRALRNYASGEPAPLPEMVALRCRARFVVTSISANGMPVPTVTPTIDGVLSPGEWDDADVFGPTPVGLDINAWVYVKNDRADLLIAIRFDRDTSFLPVQTVFAHLDADPVDRVWNAGATGNGDDLVVVQLGELTSGTLYDSHFRSAVAQGQGDELHGGTNDGAAAVVNDGSTTVVEISHPLASGDTRDIDLQPGEEFGLHIGTWIISANVRAPEQGYEVHLVPRPSDSGLAWEPRVVR